MQRSRSSLLISCRDSGLWLQERSPSFRGYDFALLLIAEDKRMFLPVEDECHGKLRFAIVLQQRSAVTLVPQRVTNGRPQATICESTAVLAVVVVDHNSHFYSPTNFR
jgi:hypothetical protein